MNVRLVAVDVDGTITEASRDLRLSHEGIEAVRRLSSSFIVVLISGSSLPVVASLSLYLGTNGPVVAENGCIAMHRDLWEEHVCRAPPPSEAIEALERMGFKRSWHNRYRHYDIAFRSSRPVTREMIEEARRAVEQYDSTVIWSGFALHLQRRGGGKDKGLEAVLRRLNLSWDEVASVGDGENDIPMLLKARVSAATGDSSEEVKRAAKIVLREAGGKGLMEFADILLGSRRA